MVVELLFEVLGCEEKIFAAFRADLNGVVPSWLLVYDLLDAEHLTVLQYREHDLFGPVPSQLIYHSNLSILEVLGRAFSISCVQNIFFAPLNFDDFLFVDAPGLFDLLDLAGNYAVNAIDRVTLAEQVLVALCRVRLLSRRIVEEAEHILEPLIRHSLEQVKLTDLIYLDVCFLFFVLV